MESLPLQAKHILVIQHKGLVTDLSLKIYDSLLLSQGPIKLRVIKFTLCIHATFARQGIRFSRYAVNIAALCILGSLAGLGLTILRDISCIVWRPGAPSMASLFGRLDGGIHAAVKPERCHSDLECMLNGLYPLQTWVLKLNTKDLVDRNKQQSSRKWEISARLFTRLVAYGYFPWRILAMQSIEFRYVFFGSIRRRTCLI